MAGKDRAKEGDGNLEKIMKALVLAQISNWKQREQIALLDRAGFGQKEIAGILGTTSKVVSVRLAEIRKNVRNKKR